MDVVRWQRSLGLREQTALVVATVRRRSKAGSRQEVLMPVMSESSLGGWQEVLLAPELWIPNPRDLSWKARSLSRWW